MPFNLREITHSSRIPLKTFEWDTRLSPTTTTCRIVEHDPNGKLDSHEIAYVYPPSLGAWEEICDTVFWPNGISYTAKIDENDTISPYSYGTSTGLAAAPPDAMKISRVTTPEGIRRYEVEMIQLCINTFHHHRPGTPIQHPKCPGLQTVWNGSDSFVESDGKLKCLFTEWHLIAPSVTTILDKMVVCDQLEQWKRDVGQEKATEIAQSAAIQGSNVHYLVQQYVNNWSPLKDVLQNTQLYTTIERSIFHMLRQRIDQVDQIVASEAIVLNPFLGYIGSVDLVVKQNGQIVVIDIKTYRKYRDDEFLLKAKLQVALYSEALRVCHGINVSRAEIVYANLTTGLVTVPVDLAEMIPIARTMMAQYNLLYR